MDEIEFAHTIDARAVGERRAVVVGSPDAAVQIVTGATSVRPDGVPLTATPEFWLPIGCPSGRHSRPGQ